MLRVLLKLRMHDISAKVVGLHFPLHLMMADDFGRNRAFLISIKYGAFQEA